MAHSAAASSETKTNGPGTAAILVTIIVGMVAALSADLLLFDSGDANFRRVAQTLTPNTPDIRHGDWPSPAKPAKPPRKPRR
jgi:hypothetical protein